MMFQNCCRLPHNKGETPSEQYCNPSTMQIVVHETSLNAEGIILSRSLSLLIGKCFCAVQTDRYAEYPKLKELVERKDGLIAARATAPTFLKVLALNPLLLSLQPFTQQIAAAAANAQALPSLHLSSLLGHSVLVGLVSHGKLLLVAIMSQGFKPPAIPFA